MRADYLERRYGLPGYPERAWTVRAFRKPAGLDLGEFTAWRKQAKFVYRLSSVLVCCKKDDDGYQLKYAYFFMDAVRLLNSFRLSIYLHSNRTGFLFFPLLFLYLHILFCLCSPRATRLSVLFVRLLQGKWLAERLVDSFRYFFTVSTSPLKVTSWWSSSSWFVWV